MLKKILIIFIFIIFYKFISNFINYKYLSDIEHKYGNWITSKNKDPNFVQCKNKVISLFKKANISDSYIQITQPTGFGIVSTQKVSAFQNFPSLFENFTLLHFNMIIVAKGTYKQRALEAFNPLYWIDLFIFLPKNILKYIGFDNETSIFKILNCIFSFFYWLICILFTLFNTEIHNIIIKIFT